MSPVVVLAAARAAGVNIRVISGRRLVAEPAAKLTDDLRAQIRGAKEAIVDLLLADAAPVLAEPPRRGRYAPEPPIPTVCSWCGEPVTTPPGTLPLARRTACGDLLHAECWAASTRPLGCHQPPTPDLDRLMRKAEQDKGGAA